MREELSKRIAEWSQANWALSTLSAACEAGVIAALREPASAARVADRCGLSEELVAPMLDVLVAIGAARREGDRFVVAIDGTDQLHLAAELRSTLLQTQALTRDRGLVPGWNHVDPDLIQAQATVSKGITHATMRRLGARLEGLEPRLRSTGARFLDVGAGAAGMCIAMAELYPELSIVGLEPAPVPLAQAHKNVAAAGLGGRIALRAHGVEALDEEAGFDCIYLAQMFFPEPAFQEGMRRVFRALKPGGWLLTGAVATAEPDLAGALSRFRGTLWGGGPRLAEHVAQAARAVGFSDVRVVPSPGMSPVFARKS